MAFIPNVKRAVTGAEYRCLAASDWNVSTLIILALSLALCFPIMAKSGVDDGSLDMDATMRKINHLNEAPSQREYIRQRRTIAEQIEGRVAQSSTLTTKQKVELYDALKNEFGSKARFGAAQRKKVLAYSRKIIESAQGKVSPEILAAYVDYAHAITGDQKRTKALVSLHGLLTYIRYAQADQLAALMLEDNPDAGVIAVVRQRAMAFRRTAAKGVLHSNVKVDGAKTLQKFFPILGETMMAGRLNEKAANVQKEPGVNGRQGTAESRKQESKENSILEQVADVRWGRASADILTPHVWMRLLEDESTSGGGMRVCDRAVSALMQTFHIHLEMKRTVNVVNLSIAERDAVIGKVQKILFDGKPEVWDEVRRNIVSHALAELADGVKGWLRVSATWQLRKLLGTDFAYAARQDKQKAVREARAYWSSVNDKPSSKWIDADVVDKYESMRNAIIGHPENSQAAQAVRVDVAGDPALRRLLLDVGEAEKELETTGELSIKKCRILIDRINGFEEKYRGKPQWKVLSRIRRALQKFIERQDGER